MSRVKLKPFTIHVRVTFNKLLSLLVLVSAIVAMFMGKDSSVAFGVGAGLAGVIAYADRKTE